MPRYYHIITMGCQMNEYDSDYLAQILLTAGYIPTDDYNNAQLILINTCTVRAKAQQKAVSLLGRMVYVKRRNPDLILGVMGCIAQQEGSRLIDRFPEIDLVLGTRETGNILEYLDNIEGKRKNVVATDISLTLPSLKNHQGYFKGRLRSFIAVMEGCDNFCSYCIVPYVRGRETSRLPGDVIEEAEDLLSEGVKEVTLLGQNVNSYLSKGEKDVNFPDLLRMLSKLDGLERIRFTTSHPKDLSRDMIQCFGELDNLCPHIHLPFQSGSNRILKMMNRGYTREQYLDLIRQLREVRPEIAITSDVMVGFPRETEEDFNFTLDLIRDIEFDNLFSFIYSDRTGTLAEKMDGKVDSIIKSERLSVLQNLQKEITLKKNKELIGKTAKVLVEGRSKRGEQFAGRTDTFKVVNFHCNTSLIGELIDVSIEKAFMNSLQGKLAEKRN